MTDETGPETSGDFADVKSALFDLKNRLGQPAAARIIQMAGYQSLADLLQNPKAFPSVLADVRTAWTDYQSRIDKLADDGAKRDPDTLKADLALIFGEIMAFDDGKPPSIDFKEAVCRTAMTIVLDLHQAAQAVVKLAQPPEVKLARPLDAEPLSDFAERIVRVLEASYASATKAPDLPVSKMGVEPASPSDRGVWAPCPPDGQDDYDRDYDDDGYGNKIVKGYYDRDPLEDHE